MPTTRHGAGKRRGDVSGGIGGGYRADVNEARTARRGRVALPKLPLAQNYK